MFQFFLLIFYLFIFCFSCQEQNSQNITEYKAALIEKNNKLAASHYNMKSYSLTTKNLLDIIENGNISPNLFYNLANSYFQQNKIGSAIYYYSQGITIYPHFSALRSNLLKIIKQNQENPNFFINAQYQKMLLQKTQFHFIPFIFLVVLYCILWVCFLLLILYQIQLWLSKKLQIDPSFQFSKAFSLKLKLKYIAYITVLLFLAYNLTISYLFIKNKKENFGVVISPNIYWYSMLNEDDSSLIQEGSIIKIIKKKGIFYQIKLNKNLNGFIHKNNVKIIEKNSNQFISLYTSK